MLYTKAGDNIPGICQTIFMWKYDISYYVIVKAMK